MWSYSRWVLFIKLRFKHGVHSIYYDIGDHSRSCGAAACIKLRPRHHCREASSFGPYATEMTLLLVMLHTGTMLALSSISGRSGSRLTFSSRQAAWLNMKLLLLATMLTGIVGIVLKTLIERLAFRNAPKSRDRVLFGNLPLIANSTRCCWDSYRVCRAWNHETIDDQEERPIQMRHAVRIGTFRAVPAVPGILKIGCNNFYPDCLSVPQSWQPRIQLCTRSHSDTSRAGTRGDSSIEIASGYCVFPHRYNDESVCTRAFGWFAAS